MWNLRLPVLDAKGTFWYSRQPMASMIGVTMYELQHGFILNQVLITPGEPTEGSATGSVAAEGQSDEQSYYQAARQPVPEPYGHAARQPVPEPRVSSSRWNNWSHSDAWDYDPYDTRTRGRSTSRYRDSRRSAW